MSDVHGTTRDSIEDTTTINGVTFRFIDTAGLRETDDLVEIIGIERTHQKMSQAQIVLWVIDSTPSDEEAKAMQAECQGKKLLVVFNKSDLQTAKPRKPQSPLPAPPRERLQYISAKFDKDLASLEDAIYAAADIPEINESSIIVTNTRHYEALSHSLQSIETLIEGLSTGIPTDLLAEDLRTCLHTLAAITGGEITHQETLTNIFSHFCIGK